MIQPISLQQRLALYLIIPVAVLLMVMGFAGFIYARNLILSQWQEAAILRLQRAAHRVDMRIERTKDWIQIFHQIAGSQDTEPLAFWAIEQLKQQEGVHHVSVIWNNTNHTPHAGSIDDKMPRIGHTKGSMAGEGGPHLMMRPFHSARIREITPPRYDETVAHEMVSLISDLNDQTGQPIGRLEVMLDFDVLMKDIRESGWWQSNKAFLVNHNGMILAETSSERRGSLSDNDDPLERKTVAAMKIDPSGTILGEGHPPKEVSGFYKLHEAPWSLVMIAPGNMILSPIVRFRFFYFASAAGLIILIVVFIRIVTGQTVFTIQEVSNAARRVAKGDYSQHLQVKTRDEVGELTRSFNSMVDQLKERMEMKQAMNLAMEVQQNLLPKKMPQINGLEIAAHSIYCDETGGDLYDFFEVNDHKHDHIGVAVGDVAGHGIPAALLMATVRAFLKSRVTQPGSIAEIISDVNRLVTHDTGDTGQFMTLFYAAIDARSRVLRWVRAGHDPAVFYDPAKDSFVELGGAGMALGVDGRHVYQESGIVELSEGQILLVGTDGLRETQNESGEMFGKTRIENLIRRLAGRSADSVLTAIIRAVQDFRASAKQEDDITLAVIKVVN